MDKWGESAGATGKVPHVQQYIMLPISTDQNVGRYWRKIHQSNSFNNWFFKILSYKQAVDLELDAVAALGNIRSKR